MLALFFFCCFYDRQRPHTQEKEVRFYLFFCWKYCSCMRRGRQKEPGGRDVRAETFRRWNVQCDQSHAPRRIDCAHQMKHFKICSFISPSRFQWKSMVIKLNQKSFVFFISLLGLATVYASMSWRIDHTVNHLMCQTYGDHLCNSRRFIWCKTLVIIYSYAGFKKCIRLNISVWLEELWLWQTNMVSIPLPLSQVNSTC